MTFIIELDDGRSQIDKTNAFCELLNQRIPDKEHSITELFDSFDDEILSMDERITKQALSNCHGDWYEWLLAISAWNYHVENPDSFIALLLPNISSFDVVSLYKRELYDLVLDLRKKIAENTSVRLISSNPDFVIINASRISHPDIFDQAITAINNDTLGLLKDSYKKFISNCNFEDIVGYLSVKTSLRPDRRLQIPHEGSLMKAIYIHLQTRKWILNPKGLKYFAITTKVSESDRNALKTVATHSIINVHDIPQAAVDEVFEVNSLQDAERVFEQILS